MKKLAFLVAVFLVVAAGAAAISSEPVYISGLDHGKTVLLAIESVRTEMKTIKDDPELLKAITKLEPTLAALQKKCEAAKDKPVEVTSEYTSLAATGKAIDEMKREHVLLAKRVKDLLQKIVSPAK